MNPIIPEDATHCFHCPEGMENCESLYVKVIDDKWFVSRWEPTEDELESLNSGAIVELWVMGGQPVVGISVA